MRLTGRTVWMAAVAAVALTGLFAASCAHDEEASTTAPTPHVIGSQRAAASPVDWVTLYISPEGEYELGYRDNHVNVPIERWTYKTGQIDQATDREWLFRFKNLPADLTSDFRVTDTGVAAWASYSTATQRDHFVARLDPDKGVLEHVTAAFWLADLVHPGLEAEALWIPDGHALEPFGDLGAADGSQLRWHWYLGQTLASSPTCGGLALYRHEGQPTRVLSPTQEIDKPISAIATIVDDLYSPSRAVAVATQCISSDPIKVWIVDEVAGIGDGTGTIFRASLRGDGPLDLTLPDPVHSLDAICRTTSMVEVAVDLTLADLSQVSLRVDRDGKIPAVSHEHTC